MLGKAVAPKTIWGKKVYLRVVINKTGREDSLSQEGGEIKQKYAISVGVNTTLKI